MKSTFLYWGIFLVVVSQTTNATRPPTHPNTLQVGATTYGRETVVNNVVNSKKSNNKICMLSPDQFIQLCGICTDIYATVYNKRIHKIEKNIKKPATCKEERAILDDTNTHVFARQCPADPVFYLSEGSKPNWVMVFVKVRGSANISFEVHLGPFNQLNASSSSSCRA